MCRVVNIWTPLVRHHSPPTFGCNSHFNVMSKKDECIIPEEALTDPKSREILRAWVANEALHVSLFIPDEWEDPGHWGVALADVTRHLADAYHKSQGVNPKQTIQRI